MADFSSSKVCSLNCVMRSTPMSSPSLRARTGRMRMVSRVSDTSNGSDRSLRLILRRTVELTGPRILSTAWFSVSPCTCSSSMWVMTSLARRPARAAGVSSIGVTTLTRPSSIVTSMPRPPNSPRVCTCMSRKLFGSM